MTETRRGTGGALRGKPQTGRRVYDPDSGRPWRTGVVVTSDEARKAITAADKAGLSFAGLVGQLIQRMEVDADGRPTWADEVQHQEELPKAG
ncbi:hypothetical protein [Streptomyces sp. BH105]|uniref:hypothetical protein n=1 Tax=Streptomyces sp. BH105 TaxID=3410408 RepID=UPI003CEABD3C